MLSEPIRQLLTAYVDGELDERQRQAAERWLRESAEAQELLRQLQADAAALRRLSRRRPPEEFAAAVLRQLAPRPVVIVSAAVRRPATPHSSWAKYGVAATVVLAVSLGAYLYYTPSQDAPPVGVVVKKGRRRGPRQPRPDSFAGLHDAASAGSDFTPDEPPRPTVGRMVEAPDALPKPTEGPAKAKAKDESGDAVLATPSPQMEVFQVVNARLALSLALKDLSADGPRKQLRAELQKEVAYRVELLSTGNTRTMARLEAAFQAHGFRLLIDQIAQARLKVRAWRTDLLLYVEDLTGEELAKLLEVAGAGTQMSAAFSQAVVLPLTPADHRELAKLLGVDPTKIEPTRKGPLGVDVRQPLAKTTAQQLQQALAGQGRPRPTSGQPAGAKAPPRLALVLAYNPVRASKPAAVPVVKEFFGARTRRRPGTLQVLIVLRGVGG
jgi:hypothetical protein